MKERSQFEQDRRDKIALRFREIRAKKHGKLWKLTTGLFPCRNCWRMVEVESIKHRVCGACRTEKTQRFEKLIEALVKAGIDEKVAEHSMLRLLYASA